MLKEYMHSLQSLRKLTAEDERRLWKKYKKDGSIDARQILIENYQLLVCREVMRFPVQETVKMDLIQEGMVGLLEAAERYNPSLQVAFSLYAVHRVRGRMLDFLQKENRELPCEMDEPDVERSLRIQAVPDVAFESADRLSLHEEVDKAMQRLPTRERDVLRNVFLKECTAAETASKMEVSTAYVYQLEKKGIRRLRGMLSRLLHDRK